MILEIFYRKITNRDLRVATSRTICLKHKRLKGISLKMGIIQTDSTTQIMETHHKKVTTKMTLKEINFQRSRQNLIANFWIYLIIQVSVDQM